MKLRKMIEKGGGAFSVVLLGRVAIFAAAMAFAALGAQAGTTYWLGTGAGASDSNAGTSKDAPFATWEHAFTQAGSANGNVLNVLPGTYTVTAVPTTWTSRNDVTIQGVDADGNPLTSATAASAVVVDGAGLGTIAPIRASFRTVFTGSIPSDPVLSCSLFLHLIPDWPQSGSG